MTNSSNTSQRWLTHFDTRYRHGEFFSNLSVNNFLEFIQNKGYIVVVLGARDTWIEDNTTVPSGDNFSFTIVHQRGNWNISYSYHKLFHERTISFDINLLKELIEDNSLNRKRFREIFLSNQEPELYPNGVYFHGYAWQ